MLHSSPDRGPRQVLTRLARDPIAFVLACASTPAQNGALGKCLPDTRRFRRHVGLRQNRRERRLTMRDPYLRILAEDAIDRRGLCPHRQDAPPAPRVS